MLALFQNFDIDANCGESIRGVGRGQSAYTAPK